MTYRLVWRLVGPTGQVLDSGRLGEFGEEASASGAIQDLLRGFAQTGLNADAGYWWGRRSPDSDLEVRLSLT